MSSDFDYSRAYTSIVSRERLLARDRTAAELLQQLDQYRVAGITDVPVRPTDETDVEVLAYIKSSSLGIYVRDDAVQKIGPADRLKLFNSIQVPPPTWQQVRAAFTVAKEHAPTVHAAIGERLYLQVVCEYLAVYELARLLRHQTWPALSDLDEDDFSTILWLENHYADGMEWKDQRSGYEASEMKRCAPMDPARPLWIAKDETRPNPWLSAVGDLAPDEQTQWDKLLLHHVPPVGVGGGRITQLLAGPVSSAEDRIVYDRVIKRMVSHVAHLLVPMGADTSDERQDWRWATTLCLVAGLGRTALRSIAQAVAASDADAGGYWDALVGLLTPTGDTAADRRTEKELDKLINDARMMCGYPISLLRVPFPQLQQVIVATQGCPKGIAAALLLWLFLRVRALPGDGGLRLVITGDQAQVVSPCVDPDVALSDGLNAKILLPLLQSHLRIQKPGPVDQRTDLDVAIVRVLASLKPGHFLPALTVDADPSVVVSTATSVHPAILCETRLGLGDVGVEVGPLLQINPTSGELAHYHVVHGLQVADAAFCLATGIPVEKLERLPRTLEPTPPFTVMRPALPQIDDLGFPGGLGALKDAVLLVSLLRSQLTAAGTVGAMLQNEYPLLLFYPHSTQVDETQNFSLNSDGDPTFRNGKTTVAVQEARILSPGIAHNGFSRSGGGPALREQAANLRRFGHDVVDEFVFVKGDMFFSRESLKELATGGSVSSGVYAGNGTAPRLRHPLFLSAKIPDAAAEMTSRTLPTFYRQITTAVMSDVSDDLRDRYLSGDLALEARLRGLLWAEREGLIKAVAALRLERSDAFRFAGHLSVAYWIADRTGVPRTEVDAYLAAAGIRCSELRRDGQAVAEEIGAVSACDPRFFLAQMTEESATLLCHLASEHGGTVKPMELAAYILGGGDVRLMKARLGRTSERRFLADLRASVQAGEFVNEFLQIAAVPDSRRSKAENRIVYRVCRVDHDERFRSLTSPRPNLFTTAPVVSAGI